MKILFLFLLFITLATSAGAQNKDNVFLDVGTNEFGVSGIYDRKLIKHFEAGGGLNVYNFDDYSYDNVYSSCYLDLRPYWSWKRGLLFEYNDMGIAVAGGRKSDTATVAPVNLYFAIGVGYCYRINKRGWGPYVSLGMYGHIRTVHNDDPNLSQRAKNYSIFDAEGILSVGFKL